MSAAIPRFVVVAVLVPLFYVPARTLPAKAAEPPATHLHLIPADADGFITARVSRIWASDVFKSYRQFMAQNPGMDGVGFMNGFPPQDIERVTQFSNQGDPVTLVSYRRAIDRKTVLAAIAPGASERKCGGKSCYRNEEDWTGLAFLDDQTMAIAPIDALEAFLRTPAVSDAPLKEVLAVAREHDLCIGGRLAESIRTSKVSPLPPGSPGEPFLNADRAHLVADVRNAEGPSALEVRAILRYDSPAKAEVALAAYHAGIKAELKNAVESLAKTMEIPREAGDPFGTQTNAAFAAVRQAQAKLEVTRAGRELHLTVTVPATDLGVLSLTVCTFVTEIRTDPVDRFDPNLEALAKAVLAYHQEHGHLPAHAVYAADGTTPLLSWRVLVLPYLGSEAKKLHAEFKMDQPWDSEHNIRLVRRMPRIFGGKDGSASQVSNVTEYQVLVGPGTLFDGTKGRPLSDATDGAENTVLIAQAFQPVPWTKPQDLVYAPDKPLPRMGGRSLMPTNSCALAFADGRVRVVAGPGFGASGADWGRRQWKPMPKFDDAPLRAVITRAGGEKVDLKTMGEIQFMGLQEKIDKLTQPLNK